MPHDRNGRKLNAGEIALVPFRILDVSQDETAFNVILEAIGPAGEYLPRVTCNSRLILESRPTDHEDPIAAELAATFIDLRD